MPYALLLPIVSVSHAAMQAASAQRDSVAVLRRLPEFGVSLLPAQLTSLPDKHQLLQRILFGRHTYAAAAAAAAGGSSGGQAGSSVAPWRRLGDVLELAALLGFGSEDEQNEVSACLNPAAWLLLFCMTLLLGLSVLRQAGSRLNPAEYRHAYGKGGSHWAHYAARQH
jgi:hypothetical protein